MNSQEKSLENLIKEKNAIINEWFNEINNFEKNDDLIWSQKNKTFADKLYNILCLLQKKSNSNNIKLQYDLINTVDKYISEKNKGKVLSIIKNLKSLEISTQENNNLDINDIDSYINSIDNKILEIEKEELDGKPEEEQILLKEKWQKEDEEKEFDKYCKLYEERFGKRTYIPELSGTKEFAIECIKKCLTENKDILDDLYYLNFKKDMENGVLYSETRNDLNNDNFDDKITDERLKIIIEEVVGNNDEYLNTTVYDIVKKIIDLPYENVATIADLISYNPSQVFAEPITQGKIMNLVKETCKKLNIKLETNKDSFGGLAYYRQFKKINQLNLVDKATLNGDEKNV